MNGRKQEDWLQWRRIQELELLASGKTMTEIADTFKIDVSTVSRDIEQVRQEAKQKHAEFIEQEIPFRHKLRTAGMDKAIKELWALFHSEKDGRTKKSILDSITDAYIKQAAIDGDPMAIQRALTQIAKVRKQLEEREQVA